jgi:hypothetical protein
MVLLTTSIKYVHGIYNLGWVLNSFTVLDGFLCGSWAFDDLRVAPGAGSH